MENKPIVTCHGNQTLFSKLHPLIVRGLMRETVEWKRSYGRPSRIVRVEATFVPFNPSILPSEDDWTLLGRPFFHTYWTDCDIEGYKSSVKEEINDWLSVLKERDIPDWMIIVIVNDDSRVKSRILRNSVYDKVKNDFCNKLPERCLVLSEPLKTDAKASESWSIVLAKMRQLLLESCGRNLGHFEEFMRGQRERRTDAKWSYCSYFLLQEELAFMYEMLGMYEDALVQYDELDALITQFVLNFAVGDNPAWLVNLAKHPATRWDGLCLSQPINIAKRQLIRHQEASLLDLRNYLFSRQCTLIFLLARPWEVGQRAIPFMHNCIKELRILEISLPEGAVDCWVYLSCLEVLKMCDTLSHLGHMETYSLCTANLWDYARTKISRLGELCGLMNPGNPTSSQLHQVVELLTGLVRTEGESEPLRDLKEALSSKAAFHKRYLELSELAMCSYKHIGRVRSARKVGKDLASFHMLLGEPQKAESYLHDAIKMFKAEGWEMLADDTRMDIAACQRATQQMTKFCRTCMYITSSPTLPKETRYRYQQELANIGSNPGVDLPLMVRCTPLFYISEIEPTTSLYTAGMSSDLRLNILSNLVEPITVDSICVSLIFWSPIVDTSPDHLEQNSIRRKSQSNIQVLSGHASGSDCIGHSREPSGSSIMGIDLYNRIKETIQASSQPLDLYVQVEGKTESGSVSSSAVVCRSPLRRLTSIPGVTKEKEIVKDEWNLLLTATDQVLNPGANAISVTACLTNAGCYLVNQLCVKYSGIEFFKNLSTECITLSVISKEPTVTLEPVCEPLLAGLDQELCFLIDDTSELYSTENPPKVIASKGLKLVSEHLSDDGALSLPSMANSNEVQMRFSVFADITDETVDCINHEVRISGGKLEEDITKRLKFLKPFRIHHVLHTAYKRKFVQLVVVGCTEKCMELSFPTLLTDDEKTSFISLCRPEQKFVVRRDQSASFLWELESSHLCADVPCTFQFSYQLTDVSTHPYEHKYSFTLKNVTTLFFWTSTLVPSYDDDDNLCDGLVEDKCYQVKLTVTAASDDLGSFVDDTGTLVPIFYEVIFDEKDWLVIGTMKGEVIINNNQFQVCVYARPQKIGHLNLPTIRLLQQVTDSCDYNRVEHVSQSNPVSQYTASDQVDSEGSSGQPEIHKTTADISENVDTKPMNDGPSYKPPNKKHTLKPLSKNQVYNCTQAQQVYVSSKDTTKHLVPTEVAV